MVIASVFYWQTWNPTNNKKFETLCYLPTLSKESIATQIDCVLTNGWIPCLEFDDVRAALQLVNFMHAKVEIKELQFSGEQYIQ